jgi:hypothetical protein
MVKICKNMHGYAKYANFLDTNMNAVQNAM